MNPYNSLIDLYAIVAMATLFSGLTLALLLGFAKRAEQTANLFLSSALVAIVLKTAGVAPVFLPALGPLLYFYVRRLTSPGRRFHRKDIFHFCPLFVGFLMPAWLVVTSVIIYLYLSHRLIEDFYRRLRLVLMDRPRYAFRRLDKALLLLGLFCASALFSDTFYFAVAFVLMGMTVDIILKPDSNLQLTLPITDRANAKEKGRRLKEAVATSRLYEDAELTLATLAEKLKMHPHDLSRIINMGLEKNFSDFINEFRVREIARKMRDPAFDRLTMLGIAYESGFNSKTTFNRVFKEMTGKTPTEYKNSLKKDVPIHIMALRSQLPPVILRSEPRQKWAYEKLNSHYMFKNHFKTAFRNLARNKVYSFINIAGLSLGLACAMLIMLYVKDEVSFDRFHKNVNNIYRIVSQRNKYKISSTGVLQGPRFMQNIPGIESFVRVESRYEDIKTAGGVQSQSLLYVDSNFFSVFTFRLLSGNAKTCLREPHSIVLSEEAAKKQFGTTDAVGKIVMLKEDSTFVPCKVTAVAKRCPQNSSIQFDVLMPFKVSDADAKDTHNWFNSFLNTFVVLNSNAGRQTVEKQMQDFYVADAKQTFQEMVKMDGGGADVTMGTYFLQPYLNMHLSLDLSAQNGLSNASNPMYSYILSGIALFVLLIACVNFVNLTVARSIRRAKEVGIRKVVGGGRKQLIMQFLGESFFLCTIAFVLAFVSAQLLLPLFNDIANKALSISYLFDAKLIAGYIALYSITGLLAGFYPALVLSGYSPVQTLYSRFQIAGKNYLQRSLVVLQFTLASFLIIATFIIYSQFNFLTKTDLGYDDNNLVIVNKNGLTHAEAAVFKNELRKNPNIVGVSVKNTGEWGTGTKNMVGPTVNFAYETVDENYLPLLKIPLIAGRNFSTAFPADSLQSVIVNESFVKKANWKNPVGETFNILGSSNETYRVIGVVKDYHFESLTKKITPQIFSMNGSYGTYYIRIKPNTATASLQWIQKTYQQFYPMSSYSYVFKNDENRKQLAAIEKWRQIILFGAILTIFISCIGLFGLSVLSAEKRTKEIGIRKVLGASVKSIVASLTTDFIKLVLFALIIAAPVAYLAANKWLQNFPYRIQISWWLFAFAGVLVMLIALFTISFQSIKAAVANPVKSLRTE